MSRFSPDSGHLEARHQLETFVRGVLAKLAAGSLPDEVERQRIDCKEEAGRRGPGGTLKVGEPRNQEAARHLANEVTCMANTPGGGALLVGVEDRTGKLIGASLDAEWLRHRIYELVDVAPTVQIEMVDGVRLLVVLVAEAREPVEDLNGRIRWRVGGHCEGVDRSEWWLHRQARAGHDLMAEVSQRTMQDIAPGAIVVARRYLAAWAQDVGGDAQFGGDRELLTALGVLRPDGRLTTAGATAFCAADRTYIAVSAIDVEGGELLSAPRDMAGLSLLEQIAMVEERLDALNTSLRVMEDAGFAHVAVRRLPLRAVREAVLNAVVHRDWMIRDPVEVTWINEDSALQVVSPGGFSGEITAETVLTQRYARYPALADLFRALHLVEKQGLGVDRMYHDMVALGHRPPLLVEEAGPRVRVRLVGGQPVVPVMKLMTGIRPEVRQSDVRIALIVYTLLREPFTTPARLTGLLQRDVAEVTEALETAADCTVDGKSLLWRHKDTWTLSWEAVRAASAGSDKDTLRRKGILGYIKPDIAEAEAVVRSWFRDHRRYTSGDHANLTGLTQTGARGQLERFERDGLLARGPGSGRSSHFVAGPGLSE